MSCFGRCAVYCANSFGTQPEFRAAAESLGRLLAERKISLVYGGACDGLMGSIADAALEAGGEVLGFMPGFMVEKELAHTGITKLEIVSDMQARKRHMLEHGDVFVALPGGIGTLEELFEVLEWSFSKRHVKPVGVLNLNGMYTPLVELLHGAVRSGFLLEECLRLFVVADEPGVLLAKLEQAATEHCAQASVAVPTKIAASTAQAPIAASAGSQDSVNCILLVGDGLEEVPQDQRAAVEGIIGPLVSDGCGIVYSGSSLGLASAVADATLQHGGRLIGVVPSFVKNAHPGLSQMEQWKDAHPQVWKESLLQHGDWVVVLPGGAAVWDVLFEVLSASVLGRVERRIGVLNVAGYYNPLLDLLSRTMECGFSRSYAKDPKLIVEDNPDVLLAKLREAQASVTSTQPEHESSSWCSLL